MEDYRLIPLHGKHGTGKYAIVDADQFAKISKHRWTMNANGTGYPVAKAVIDGERRTLSIAREILDCPDGLVVDHINGDTLDNRVSNLRICTQGQNARNRGATRNSRRQSRYKGVRRHYRKWQARIGVNYRVLHIGLFETEREAAEAYDRAARKHFGKFARLNFPETQEGANGVDILLES